MAGGRRGGGTAGPRGRGGLRRVPVRAVAAAGFWTDRGGGPGAVPTKRGGAPRPRPGPARPRPVPLPAGWRGSARQRPYHGRLAAAPRPVAVRPAGGVRGARAGGEPVRGSWWARLRPTVPEAPTSYRSPPRDPLRRRARRLWLRLWLLRCGSGGERGRGGRARGGEARGAAVYAGYRALRAGRRGEPPAVHRVGGVGAGGVSPRAGGAGRPAEFRRAGGGPAVPTAARRGRGGRFRLLAHL